MSVFRAPKGTTDVLPPASNLWRTAHRLFEETAEEYGFGLALTPLFEDTDVFARGVGGDTDVVEKQMYTFADKANRSLTLRPEATASVVRAAIQAGGVQGRVKVSYWGPMFRYERPQKGRYRQFHQIGLEAFGLAGPDIDIEVILVTHRFWQALGLSDLELQINTLGTAAERADYRQRLVAYLERHEAQLDADSRQRLQSNPLRILDSKNPQMRELIDAAPALIDHLGEASRAHFDGLRQGLEDAGVAYVVNPRLVRGLDYYGLTVFEWVTRRLGAQGTVCAGGRYDGLVEQLGGRPTPAVGFAMGVERRVARLEARRETLPLQAPDAYLVLMGDAPARRGRHLAEQLRDRLPELTLLVNCGGGSFKSQFRKADRCGAQLALILGEDELARGVVGIKSLRRKMQQREVPLEQVADYLRGFGVAGAEMPGDG